MHHVLYYTAGFFQRLKFLKIIFFGLGIFENFVYPVIFTIEYEAFTFIFSEIFIFEISKLDPFKIFPLYSTFSEILIDTFAETWWRVHVVFTVRSLGTRMVDTSALYCSNAVTIRDMGIFLTHCIRHLIHPSSNLRTTHQLAI